MLIGHNIAFVFKVHEMAMVSAIQEAQKDNLKSFNDYTMRRLEVCLALLFLSVP